MRYLFHVVVENNDGAWRAECPALQNLGAVTSGETKEEALTHIHSILLMLLLDMERKGAEIPDDEIRTNSIPIEVDTAAS